MSNRNENKKCQDRGSFSFASHCDDISKLRSKLGFLANAVATCPPGDGVLADGEGFYFTLEGLWQDLKEIERAAIAEHSRRRLHIVDHTTDKGTDLAS